MNLISILIFCEQEFCMQRINVWLFELFVGLKSQTNGITSDKWIERLHITPAELLNMLSILSVFKMCFCFKCWVILVFHRCFSLFLRSYCRTGSNRKIFTLPQNVFQANQCISCYRTWYVHMSILQYWSLFKHEVELMLILWRVCTYTALCIPKCLPLLKRVTRCKHHNKWQIVSFSLFAFNCIRMHCKMMVSPRFMYRHTSQHLIAAAI